MRYCPVALNIMAKTPKPVPATDPARKQAVIYARVSSKEQEKEGFSIPAQLKLLKDYAAAQGFGISEEYVDVETAKQTAAPRLGQRLPFSGRIPRSARFWWRKRTGFTATRRTGAFRLPEIARGPGDCFTYARRRATETGIVVTCRIIALPHGTLQTQTGHGK